jgi:hypothetical protein
MKNPIIALFLNLSGSNHLAKNAQTANAPSFFMTLVEKLLQGPRQLLQHFNVVRTEIMPNPGLVLSGSTNINGIQPSTKNALMTSEIQISPDINEAVNTVNPEQTLITESPLSEVSSEEQTISTQNNASELDDSGISSAVQEALKLGIAVESNQLSNLESVDSIVTAEEQPLPLVSTPHFEKVSADHPNTSLMEGPLGASSGTQQQASAPQSTTISLPLVNNPVFSIDQPPAPVEAESGLERLPNQPPPAPDLSSVENPLPPKAYSGSANPEQIRLAVQQEEELILDSPIAKQTIENQSNQSLPSEQPRLSNPVDSAANRFNGTLAEEITFVKPTPNLADQTKPQSEPASLAPRLERVLNQSPAALHSSEAESVPRDKMPIESPNPPEIRRPDGEQEQTILKPLINKTIVEIRTASHVQKGPFPESSSNKDSVNRLIVTTRAENPAARVTSNVSEIKTSNFTPDVTADSLRPGVITVVKENPSGERLPSSQPLPKATQTSFGQVPISRSSSTNQEPTSGQESLPQESTKRSPSELNVKNLNGESSTAKPDFSHHTVQVRQSHAPDENKNYTDASAQSPTTPAKQSNRSQSALKVTQFEPANQTTAAKPKEHLEKLAPEFSETATIRNFPLNQDNIYPVDKAFRLALINRITQIVEQSQQKNSREMTFRIQASDNELLELRFIKDTQSNRGRIVTGSEALAESIQRQMPIIVQNLESKGIHFAELSVSLSNAENFSAQARPQASRSSSPRLNQARSDKETSQEESIKKTYYLGYNTIDYVA